MIPNSKNEPIDIYEGTLVRLHKVLKEDDVYRAERIAAKRGDIDGRNPTIVIDFKYVTSIQKDFKYGGTVVMDAKTACIVIEPLEDVLDAWCEVKRNMECPVPER
jgi:hypothetical protein